MDDVKTILDLCSGTGSWSKPYKDAGYHVVEVDIKNGQDVKLFEFPDYKVHGILAAPPCTEFSYAKHFHGKDNYKHDFVEGLSIVDACLRIISVTSPKWWVLENPYNYLRRWLGEPLLIFDPWQYGDKYQKKTALWGKFSLPQPTVKTKPLGIKKFSLLKSHEIHPKYYGTLDRQSRRAVTPPGFAQAFFEANP